MNSNFENKYLMWKVKKENKEYGNTAHEFILRTYQKELYLHDRFQVIKLW
jgi:hypothetical protein